MGFLALSAVAFVTLVVGTSNGRHPTCRPCRLAILALAAIFCSAGIFGTFHLLGALVR